MSEPTVADRRDPSGTNGAVPADDEKEFLKLADQWHQATGHFSFLPQKYRHAAYQRILAMGHRTVPLILRRLKEEGGWWFEALASLTNEDPAKEALGYDSCREAWLKWGKEKGLVD
jgi:hypothetical protein